MRKRVTLAVALCVLGATAIASPVYAARCFFFFCGAVQKSDKLQVTHKKKPVIIIPKVQIDFKKLRPEECGAMIIVGEADREPMKGKKAVAYVSVMEARETGRSMCQEAFSGRYDSLSKSADQRARVVRSRGTPSWREALEIARNMIKNPTPPDKQIVYARNFYNVDDSSAAGKKWFQESTVRLLKIGLHWFCAPKKYATEALASIAVPLPRTRPVPLPRERPDHGAGDTPVALNAVPPL
jgi:hypothetical protein